MSDTESGATAVTPENFRDLIGRSREIPVLLFFWTDQVPASVPMKDTLQTLARQYQGKALVGFSDVAADPVIAQQLQVRDVPCIKVIRDGGLAEEVNGAQGEPVLRELFDRLTMSSGDLVRGQLRTLLDEGNYDAALGLLNQALQQEPNNAAFRIELADLLARKGDIEGARSALAGVAGDTPELARPQERIALLEDVAALPTLAELQGGGTAQGPEGQHSLVLRLAAEDHWEQALEGGLALMRGHSAWNDEQPRRTLIRLFTILGKGHPLVKDCRRRMFALLH